VIPVSNRQITTPHRMNRRPKSRQSINLPRGLYQARLYSPGQAIPLAPSKTPYNQTFIFQGWTSANVLTSSVVSSVVGATNFNLSALGTMATNLAAVFDEYRIREVELWLEPDYSQVLESTPEPAILASAVDLDNATAPASFAAIQSKPGALVASSTQRMYYRFRPRPALALYNGAFTAYAEAGEPWIDSSSTTVQHYGLKYGVSTTTSVMALTLRVRYTVEFRGINA
jgi:hypothetical protein